MKFETFEYLWEQGIVPAVKNVIDEIPEKRETVAVLSLMYQGNL